MPRHLKPKRKAALEAMTQMLGSDHLMHQVDEQLDLIVIAEDVIANTQCTREQNRAAFGLMCPPPILRGKCDVVQKAHFQELMDRVVAGADTRPGTRAECLCAMMGSALLAPLNTAGMVLTDWLFSQVMPGKDLGLSHVREQWNGQRDDDYAVVQHKCAMPDRVVS